MKPVGSGDMLSLPSLIMYMVHGLHDVLTVEIGHFLTGASC